MSHSDRIVLFTGVQRLARSLRHSEYTTACLRRPGERVSSPEDVDIWVDYCPDDLSSLETWTRMWPLRERVVAIINRRETRVMEHACLNRALNRIGITPDQARVFRDKLLMRKALNAKAPLFNPRYAEVDINGPPPAEPPFPFLLKPRNLFKSQLVTLCRTPRDWQLAADNVAGRLKATEERHGIQLDTSFLAESFIDGQEISMDALITRAGEIIFTPPVECVPARAWSMNDFHVADRHLPARVTAEQIHRALVAVKASVEAFALKSTPVHIDLVLKNDQVRILDVAPRIGGYRSEMMQLAYGCPLDPLNLEVAMGNRPEWQPLYNHGAAVVEIFPSRSGSLRAVHGLEVIRALPSFLRLHQRIPLGERAGWAKDGFRCPFFVVLRHEKPEQVREDVETVHRHLFLSTGST